MPGPLHSRVLGYEWGRAERISRNRGADVHGVRFGISGLGPSSAIKSQARWPTLKSETQESLDTGKYAVSAYSDGSAILIHRRVSLVSTLDERYQGFLRKLREAREKRGLTQLDVACLLGKPQSYVSRCESGERRLDVIELAEIAAIYEMPLEDFLPQDGDAVRHSHV